MAKGITQDARVLWLFLAERAYQWWTDTALTHHWRPTYHIVDMQAHMLALHQGGYVERVKSGAARCSAYQYAVTAKCIPLPGYQLDGLTVINLNPETPATMATITSANAPHAQADKDNLAQPDRINRLAGSHIPVVPVSRQGAMDYARIPSLHMGKRRDFRSEAAR